MNCWRGFKKTGSLQVEIFSFSNYKSHSVLFEVVFILPGRGLYLWAKSNLRQVINYTSLKLFISAAWPWHSSLFCRGYNSRFSIKLTTSHFASFENHSQHKGYINFTLVTGEIRVSKLNTLLSLFLTSHLRSVEFLFRIS